LSWKPCSHCQARKSLADFPIRYRRRETAWNARDDAAGHLPSEMPFEVNQEVIVRRSTCRQCEARRQRFKRSTNTQADSMFELGLATKTLLDPLTIRQTKPYTVKLKEVLE